MVAFIELRDHLSGVRIAHHIRGRIRLKLESYPAGLALPGKHTHQLQTVANRIPGFYSVRINLLARSCAVEYDPAVIPDQAWRDFLAGTDSPAAAILEQILRETYQEIMNAKL